MTETCDICGRDIESYEARFVLVYLEGEVPIQKGKVLSIICPECCLIPLRELKKHGIREFRETSSREREDYEI